MEIMVRKANHGDILGNKLAGFVHAVLRDAPDFAIMAPRRFVYIESLGVKKEYQKTELEDADGRRL